MKLCLPAENSSLEEVETDTYTAGPTHAGKHAVTGAGAECLERHQ